MTSKSTSAEIALSPSAIDGTELVRISKFIDGEWQNFKVNDQALANWILAQIVLPPVAAQLQSSWTQTDATKVDYIKEKSTTTNVASLQAASTAGALNPDVWYFISDAQSSFGVVRVRAITNTLLERKATLIKDGVIYDINYTINNGSGVDVISYLRDDINNNTLQGFNDGVSDIISIIPFDGSWYGNVFNSNTFISISDVAKCTINSSDLHNCVITMDDNGSTDLIGCQVGDVVSVGSSFSISGKSGGVGAHIFGLRMGTGCGVTALNGAKIDGCRIEDNSSLSLDDNGADGTTQVTSTVVTNNTIINIKGVSGGVGTTLNSCSLYDMNGSVDIIGGENYLKKELSPAISTFDSSRTIAGSGAFSFIDSIIVPNYNRSFVGIWTIGSVAPRDITSFTDRTAGTFTHKVTFVLDAGSSPITFKDNGADIKLAGGIDAVLTTEGDFITLSFSGQVATEYLRMIQ